MSHMLDANACIEFLRHGANSKVGQKLHDATPGSVYLNSVVLGELLFGARRSKDPEKALASVELFSAPYLVLPFDESLYSNRCE
ncbi:MAG: type II toxin-antitoxin system VapC family toxin [Fimbriiglobus sp.]